MLTYKTPYRKWRLLYCASEIRSHKHFRCLCSCTDKVSTSLQHQRISTTVRQVIKNKKKKPVCQPVLGCFDQQYSRELGNLWTSARAVLLEPHSWQYGAMLNRFTVLTDIKHMLQTQGFSRLLPQSDACALPSTTTSSSNGEVGEGRPSFPHSLIYKSPELPQEHPTPHPSVCQDTLSEPLSSSCLTPNPSNLQCYVPQSSWHLPSQAHRPGQLKQYYLLNAASLLPVLALKVRDGEKVLDLCSAPGGKALAIMQAATPALLCCNEPDRHRHEWLAKTLESFLPNFIRNRVIVSNRDGRSFGQTEMGSYDKVLVDAPCSNDRSWLYSSSGLQAEQRLKDQAKLPSLQAQLLRSALTVVRPGGVVVYSTCTLSMSENQAVVETILRTCPEAEPEDLWEELAVPFSDYFTFWPFQHDSQQPPSSGYDAVCCHRRHGILVVPQPGKTWGPMFLCRIRRKC